MNECAVVVGEMSSLCGEVEVSFGGGRIRREVGSEAKLLSQGRVFWNR